ncbi:hypothetical protein Psi02_49580 [Planotetraspora silvatica]|uniref:Uncharacterized protein n=1 Tax=Planotetraspora silvatica TaxID=234614 RepID=A0A8J3UMC4_9ACTN|nr:hypothetical protein Psi02_49580 [Planotetraspora silvatica]
MTEAGNVRAIGNTALTASLALLPLNALAAETWSVLACVVFAIIGVGTRIEAAVRSVGRDAGVMENRPQE